MPNIFVDFITSFLLGLATPLTAVCVLPLYPAFLAFIANQSTTQEISKKSYALIGAVITLGVILFMLLLGLIFTTLFQESLTSVIGIVSPIAFGILAVISLFLIFNFDFSKFFPRKFHSPVTKKPLLTALIYGFFFGAIVVPCNPAFIGAFFARALLFSNFFSSILNFTFFGLGLGFPLLLFSLVSADWSSSIIKWLVEKKRSINLIAGLLMLGISLYYLIFVFRVFG